jgi:Uma2 family endonuclease
MGGTMAITSEKLITAEDLLRMPDDGFRHELIKGELSTMPPAGTHHGLVAMRIGRVLGNFWPGAPDLAVEVVSPSDSYAEVQDKVFDWLEAGTRMVVVADPRKRVVTVFRSLAEIRVLTERDHLDGGDVVPGWALPVTAIFS